jgi:hypothetical protein
MSRPTRRRRRGYAGNSGSNCTRASGLATNVCEVAAAPCGVDVLGASTRATDTAGIAAGADGTLTFTAGDSCQFQPISMYIGLFLAIAGSLYDPAAVRKTGMLNSLKVGNVEALRRAGGLGSGINTDPYNAEQSAPLQFRSGPFASTTGQNLVMVINNPNNAAMQVTSVLWGYAI